MGPGYKAPAAPSFAGPKPGSFGLMPWLRQGTGQLNSQLSLANNVAPPPMVGGQPWYQQQLASRSQDFALQEQLRQAELLRQQQAAQTAPTAPTSGWTGVYDQYPDQYVDTASE